MEGSGPSILVVEDDASLRLLCRVNLELAGWRVLEAATLAEARAAVAAAGAVLLDLNLSGEDGRGLLTESKRDRPGRAVVLLTGASEVDEETLRLADGVVVKPFAPEELVETVDRAARVESIRGR